MGESESACRLMKKKELLKHKNDHFHTASLAVCLERLWRCRLSAGRILTQPILVCVLCPWVLCAQSPGAYPLTAREIFYAGGKKSPSPPANPKPPAAVARVQPPSPNPPSTTEKKVEAPAPNPPVERPAQPADSSSVLSVQVSNPPPDRAALKPAIRYSVLKMDAAGNAVEVDPDSVFHNGDRIQLSLEVNCPGFLYIVHRGTSGTWELLFPSPEIAGGQNAVRAGVRYQLPSPDDVMTMAGQPGEERLVPVFSRVPVKDLEDLIYSIQAQPGRKRPGQPAPGKLMVAANNLRIDDGLLSQLQLASRDLVIEKAKAKPAAPASSVPAAVAQPDLAFYAAANSTDEAARVVVNLLLDHR